MIIDLEPCYGGRYSGHNCTALFRKGGRNLTVQNNQQNNLQFNLPLPNNHVVNLQLPANLLPQQPQQQQINFRFVPKVGHAYTPILYLASQPEEGEKAKIKLIVGSKRSEQRDKKVYMLGPPPGIEVFALGKNNPKKQKV